MTQLTADNLPQRPGPPASAAPAADLNLRWALQQTEEALRALQFGTITLLVQDGVVVQLERTEKKRYQRRAAAP
jgi:hypothetical protein